MLHPLFNVFQRSMYRTGIFKRLIWNYLESASESMACKDSSLNVASIEFALVEILFWILFLGLITAFCVFSYERWNHAQFHAH